MPTAPPHPFFVPARPPHPATVVQRRAPHPATLTTPARPPHPATVLQAKLPPHPATMGPPRAPHAAVAQRAQMLDDVKPNAQVPDAKTLQDLRTAATNCKKDCDIVTEVQILKIGTKYFLSANSAKDGEQLRDNKEKAAPHIGLSPKKLTYASGPQEAANKNADGVILVPTSNLLHAEQNLLAMLAFKLSDGTANLDATNYIVGYNCPCEQCEPVVKAFAFALKGKYNKNLFYDMTPRPNMKQVTGSGDRLHLDTFPNLKKTPELFQQFAAVYETKLTEFIKELNERKKQK